MERAVGNHLEWLRREAAERFGVELEESGAQTLGRFVEELLRWNRKINLTAIVDPREAVEKHLLDSLSLVPWVPEGARVLDAGTGAGLPGVPLAVARADVRVLLVDRTEKKVLFLRTCLATLGIANAEARHARLEGSPEVDGLGLHDLAVSRAFVAPEEWLATGARYVRPGGRVVAMLGAEDPEAVVRAAGLQGAAGIEHRRFTLPSGDARALVIRTVGAAP